MATDFFYLLLDGHVIVRPDQSLTLMVTKIYTAIRITTDMKYGVDCCMRSYNQKMMKSNYNNIR